LPDLQALADAFDAPQPPAASRLRYAFGCEFPYRLALRQELGEQLLSIGLVGEFALANLKSLAAARAGSMLACAHRTRAREPAACSVCRWFGVATVLTENAAAVPRVARRRHLVASSFSRIKNMTHGFTCAGGAMALFEELELWDNLIACYRLLQKKPQAGCDIMRKQAVLA